MVNIMNWRKSSYSGSNSGNCAEVASQGNRVFVRDTQDRTGPVLRFSPAVWRRFADRMKRSLEPDWRTASCATEQRRRPFSCSQPEPQCEAA
jgi:Domain of unknown function (DUF397)